MITILSNDQKAKEKNEEKDTRGKETNHKKKEKENRGVSEKKVVEEDNSKGKSNESEANGKPKRTIAPLKIPKNDAGQPNKGPSQSTNHSYSPPEPNSSGLAAQVSFLTHSAPVLKWPTASTTGS